MSTITWSFAVPLELHAIPTGVTAFTAPGALAFVEPTESGIPYTKDGSLL